MQFELDLVFSEPIAYRAAANDNDFYNSADWRKLRYNVLTSRAGRCECCARRPTPGNPLHVDHVKPRSRYPWLALEASNLQVLCAECNLGKSNTDCTDWREIGWAS